MVTPLQLARVYATIGSYGIYRPLSITKVDPPVPGERVFPESIVRTVVHMMESVALPGGGGVKAAIKGYRIAIKTGNREKGRAGRSLHQINILLIPQALRLRVSRASRWLLLSTIRRRVNTTAAPFPRRSLVPSWAAYCVP
ncbi:peptidoglycan synthetase FtsI [Escherichia coli]|uniref:Peptidoglycan synthetase FtsI n=1 Tax=Escherichia coli TaxID=562 RepID=A0A2X1LI85_ECOLX|nr:peptidoglycan synthetase FtsI [Escherichia coli]